MFRVKTATITLLYSAGQRANQKLPGQNFLYFPIPMAFFRLSIWDLIGWCDRYINEKKPWEWENKENSAQVIFDLLFALQNIAELLSPFLPETSEKIKEASSEIKPVALFPRIIK